MPMLLAFATAVNHLLVEHPTTPPSSTPVIVFATEFAHVAAATVPSDKAKRLAELATGLRGFIHRLPLSPLVTVMALPARDHIAGSDVRPGHIRASRSELACSADRGTRRLNLYSS